MTQIQKKYFNSTDARNLIKQYGFALFPIHGIIDGHCTCGIQDCANAGKHPATPNGLKDATKDIETLAALWNKRKGLNVGIATGAISGIFVIDVDGPEGEAALQTHDIPETLTAKTGRGRHLFFKYPNKEVKTRRGVIGEKVDVRGDGGYVAGPGSNHASGATYEWINPLIDVAEAPKWLLELVYKDTVPKANTAPSPSNSVPRLFVSNQWSEADCVDLLRHIGPDLGYDEWIKIGMAIQSEGFGFHVWDNWSRGSSTKYQQNTMASHWKSFKPGSGVSFGTLVKMAQDGGWGNRSNQLINNSLITKVQKYVPLIESKKSGMFYTKFDDIQFSSETNDFVQGLLGANQLSVTYGESNCGKTFFMTDLAFHIASNKPWRDKRVEGGGVIYVALEGSYGLKNRIAAFKQKHSPAPGMPFAVVTSQVNFLDPDGNISEFIDLINKATSEMEQVKLVVVDTLSRAIAGGNENDSEDMSMLVHHADAVRQATNAHVNFIHHSGKDKARGARGHSLLRAACDTEIEIDKIEGNDYSSIRIVKQREMEAGKDMFFKLERITLGSNKYGEEIGSCVVEPIDLEGMSIKTKKSQHMNARQKFVYDVIVNQIADIGFKHRPYHDGPELMCITYDHLKDGLESAGWKKFLESKDGTITTSDKVKSATQTARESLQRMDKISFNKDYIWILNE